MLSVELPAAVGLLDRFTVPEVTCSVTRTPCGGAGDCRITVAESCRNFPIVIPPPTTIAGVCTAAWTMEVPYPADVAVMVEVPEATGWKWVEAKAAAEAIWIDGAVM